MTRLDPELTIMTKFGTVHNKVPMVNIWSPDQQHTIVETPLATFMQAAVPDILIQGEGPARIRIMVVSHIQADRGERHIIPELVLARATERITVPVMAENCPTTESRVYINGMSCTTAVNTLGSFVCYNYERVSRECCQSCLPLKRPSNTGCEYGDKSFQCRNIEKFDCYVDRNRNICCDRCQQFQSQQTDARPGCEYGDLTPRCQLIRQRPHLCYLGENQRLCCVTCPLLVDQSQPDCKWGNQNPDLCQPLDSNRRLRINCYQSAVREVCCATCKSLRERITQPIPGCDYGDSPVQFSTGRGILDCGSYLREYGIENCNNPDVAKHCCYTCFRYKYGA